MADIDIEQADNKRRTKKTIFSVGLGGLIGFIGAMGALRLADSGVLGSLGASEEIALLVAMLYALTGASVLFGLVAPNAGARFLNVEDADELREQKPMLLGSGIGMLALGGLLVMAALGGEGGVSAPATTLMACAVLLVVAAITSIRSWRLQDELMRAVGSETAGLAFYIVVLAGGTWSLLAHLGYAAGPAPLDWLTMFWAFLLLAAFIVVGRRGMMKMR
ncbi:hypothetical protein [Aurantiacibacter gangjinensis]|uniref:Uncharacterized protein n=1 Tax=Aurantiacibacter gangjinensis TaxID=502682 RepID=A0A0G9MW18_9SPHN|nr:hypothetical protein [Aurantiacibacter gangjinensis]APE27038.1 hypothetical protein BMF35_a0209 [Aurantiacibacter gangjinensis]KLE33473.1 hypothetical protein AAW01_06040 [Aurantiacibacter gangjinensis]